MFTPFELPDYLNPEYMRGYVDGYEMARQEIIRRVKEMESLQTTSGTAEVNTPGIIKVKDE